MWLSLLLVLWTVQSPAEVGAISGVVIDASTGQPVAEAMVTLVPLGNAMAKVPSVRTDVRGRFVFTPIPAHTTYWVSVVKPGYIDGVFARTSVSTELGDRIELAPRQWMKDVSISLVKFASLRGRVLDESGHPLIGLHVVALEAVVLGGRRRWATRLGASTTDDRGEYELSVPPGAFVVMVPSTQFVSPVDASGARWLEETAVFPSTYFPSGQSPDSAAVLEVQAGERREGLEVRMQLAHGYRVTGRLIGATSSFAGVGVRLLPVNAADTGTRATVAAVTPSADGAFVFDAIPAGTYVLEAGTTSSELVLAQAGPSSRPRQPRLPRLPGIPPGGNGQSLYDGPESSLQFQTSGATVPGAWGRLTITVEHGNLDEIALVLQPTAVISGRVRWDDGVATMGNGWLNAEPDGGSALQPYAFAKPTDDGRFEIQGLTPGSYYLTPRRRTFIKSITWKGEDFTNRPLVVTDSGSINDVELTMTTLSASVSGAVTNLPDPHRASVVYFPVDEAGRMAFGLTPLRIGAVPVIDGRYHAASLPAGDYWFVVTTVPNPLALRVPEFLSSLTAFAQRITVTWGQTLLQDLRHR